MKKLIILILIFAGFLLGSCVKQNTASTGGCWDCTDADGNSREACGSSEQDAYDGTSISGIDNIGDFREHCHKR